MKVISLAEQLGMAFPSRHSPEQTHPLRAVAGSLHPCTAPSLPGAVMAWLMVIT